MSRVADALRKAGQAQRYVGSGSAVEGGGRAPLEMSAVAAPWDLEREPEHGSDDRVLVHERPIVGRSIVSARPVPAEQGADYQGSPEFVELVQRVFRPLADEPAARAVVFASLARTGSSAALDVARTLAGHAAGTVCLVDATLGLAALHEQAGLPIGPGLCDAVLTGRSAVSVAVPMEHRLWMVPAGEQGLGQVLRPEALAHAVRELAARFDFLIVEAPSLEDGRGMPTLLTLAPLTDGVVLVLEAERTRRDVAAGVVARLRASGIATLGAVLANQRRPSRVGLARR